MMMKLDHSTTRPYMWHPHPARRRRRKVRKAKQSTPYCLSAPSCLIYILTTFILLTTLSSASLIPSSSHTIPSSLPATPRNPVIRQSNLSSDITTEGCNLDLSDECKTQPCFIFLDEDPFVILPPPEWRNRTIFQDLRPFPCKNFRERNIDGVSFQLLELFFRHQPVAQDGNSGERKEEGEEGEEGLERDGDYLCYFGGDDCQWNNLVNYVTFGGRTFAEKEEGVIPPKQLILFGSLLETPSRLVKSSTASVSYADDTLVIVGRTEDVSQSLFATLVGPLDRLVWAMVGITLFIAFVTGLLLKYSDPRNISASEELGIKGKKEWIMHHCFDSVIRALMYFFDKDDIAGTGESQNEMKIVQMLATNARNKKANGKGSPTRKSRRRNVKIAEEEDVISVESQEEGQVKQLSPAQDASHKNIITNATEERLSQDGFHRHNNAMTQDEDTTEDDGDSDASRVSKNGPWTQSMHKQQTNLSFRIGAFIFIKVLFSITITFFFAIFLLFYEAALTNFLFQQNTPSLRQAVTKVSLEELTRYSALRNSAVNDVWVKLQERNGNWKDRSNRPWVDCRDIDTCFAELRQGKSDFLVVQDRVARFKIKNGSSCSELSIYDTQEPLFDFNAGLIYGEDVSEDYQKKIDLELLNSRVRGDSKRIYDKFLENADCQRDVANITWKVYILPTCIVCGGVGILIVSQLCLIYYNRQEKKKLKRNNEHVEKMLAELNNDPPQSDDSTFHSQSFGSSVVNSVATADTNDKPSLEAASKV